MASPLSQQTLKLYQQHQGNFRTGGISNVRRESDLEKWYYPGILSILEKIRLNPESQDKYCRHHKTIGIISTCSPHHYPLLTAKAALLSEIADVNVIPLLVKYDQLKDLPDLLRQISPSFRAMYCTDLRPHEKAMLTSGNDFEIPLLFEDDMQAAAALVAIKNAAKFMKKSFAQVKITIEGTGALSAALITLLNQEGAKQLTLLDRKGPLYQRRPNMNRSKIDLVKLLQLSKDDRPREDVLKETEIYVFSAPEDLSMETTKMLPEKATILSFTAQKIEHGSKQAVISTLPSLPNHLTDLHVTAGISAAIADGKKFTEKTLKQAMEGLGHYFRKPKAHRLLPGLMEKGLAKKIAAAIS